MRYAHTEGEDTNSALFADDVPGGTLLAGKCCEYNEEALFLIRPNFINDDPYYCPVCGQEIFYDLAFEW